MNSKLQTRHATVPQGAVEPETPGLTRRIMAMLYDSFLVVALVLIACFWLPFLPAEFSNSLVGRSLKLAYALLIIFAFFGWFWTHGGQTLGMRAWRLQLVGHNGQPLDWRRCVVRFFAAWLAILPVGLGYLWSLIDTRRYTWHDHLSSSHLVLLPKHSKKAALADRN